MAQGYKDFTAGAILTAADLEDYTQNQSTMRFASAAARDAALTTVKTEGMRAYLLDVNTTTVYSGAAWSTIGPVHGALNNFTPVVVQGATPTLTVNISTWSRVGRLIKFQWVVTITSNGTAANAVLMSLPVNMAAGWVSIHATLGVATITDTSAVVRYPALVVASSASQVSFYPSSVDNAPTANLGVVTFTAALASGDIIGGTVEYEAAADA